MTNKTTQTEPIESQYLPEELEALTARIVPKLSPLAMVRIATQLLQAIQKVKREDTNNG